MIQGKGATGVGRGAGGLDSSSRLERGLLLALVLFTAFSVLGYATFGRHPWLLTRIPTPVASFYAVSFIFFPQAHIWLAFGVLAVVLARRAGPHWIPAFVALYAISLTSELLGTGYGLPFGEYAYRSLLGPMWLDRVPVIIPLSWFFMAVPSYAVAVRAHPGSGVGRALLASLVLTSWDLSLDPAMSYLTTYWVWGGTGPYYGMPWLNLLGWYVTGLLLMGALAALRADRWIGGLPLGWLLGFYGANLLLPLGMLLASGLWLGVAASVGAVAVCAGWFRVRTTRRPAEGTESTVVETA